MMAFSWERAISAQSCSKKSWSSAKSSLRWPSPRTFSSRIRVYLLLELALLRKYALFFCSKTKFTHKNLRHLLERSEEHTSELQSQFHLVCRLLLEKKKIKRQTTY